MNIHHDNCCHPLDKMSLVPVNHGRPSKSNVGDNKNDNIVNFVLARVRAALLLK